MSNDWVKDAFIMFNSNNPEYKKAGINTKEKLIKAYDDWLIRSGEKANRTIREGNQYINSILNQDNQSIKNQIKNAKQRINNISKQPINSTNKSLNTIYKNGTTMEKALAKEGLTNLEKVNNALNKLPSTKNKILKYAPITGDVYDVIRGSYKATHGHPILGGTQLAVGLGGLALDVPTLGLASLGKSAAKAGLKTIGIDAIKNALENASKSGLVKTAKIGGTILPELGYWIVGDNNQYIQQEQPINNKQVIDLSKGNGQAWTNNDLTNNKISSKSNYKYPYTDSIEKIILDATRGNNTIQNNNQQIDTVQNVQQQITPEQYGDVINQYRQQIEEANAPQIEAIGNLINNYNDLSNKARQQQRFWNAFSAFSNNPIYKENAYNPLTEELDRIKLIEALQQAKLGNQDKVNELIGGTAIMKQLGLPEEAAFANKDILNAWIKDLQTARALEGRKYAADLGLQGREYSANLGYQGKVDAANIMVDGLLKRQLSANGGNLQRAIVSTMGNISAMGGDPNIVLDYLQTQEIITPQQRAGLNASGTGLAGTSNSQNILDIARGNSNR